MSENSHISQVAGGVIFHPEKRKVVVVNQNGNSWSLPKGHIDPGETAEQAAIREIYEETGIQNPRLIEPLGNYERHRIALGGGDDLSELKQFTMFLFESTQNELTPLDPHNPEARWVEPSEVGGLLTHPKDAAFFQEIALPILKEKYHLK